MTLNKISIISTLINGLSTLILLLILAFNAGKPPIEIVTKYYWTLMIAVIISLIAAWRSHSDIKRLIIGKHSWLRPACEGFILGFSPIPLFHIVGISQEAFAAGPPWPTIGYSSLEVWIQYLFWLISISTAFGVVCSMYAILLSGINRMILRIYR
jgi:hypothetical protein